MILFDTFWARGNEERKSDVKISDKIKIRLINNRKRIETFYLAAIGHIEGSIIPKLINECNLTETEEAELWSIFHKLWHDSSSRDCNKINGELGLYLIIDKKIKWFGKINVLDIGCGKNGNGISTLVNKYGGKIRGFGVDLDIEEHPSNVKLVIGNAEALPFPANKFDVVYSQDVIYYFNNTRIIPVIKEIMRVLNLKGVFLFNDHNRDAEFYKRKVLSVINVNASVVNQKGSVKVITKLG